MVVVILIRLSAPNENKYRPVALAGARGAFIAMIRSRNKFWRIARCLFAFDFANNNAGTLDGRNEHSTRAQTKLKSELRRRWYCRCAEIVQRATSKLHFDFRAKRSVFRSRAVNFKGFFFFFLNHSNCFYNEKKKIDSHKMFRNISVFCFLFYPSITSEFSEIAGLEIVIHISYFYNKMK